MIRKAAPLALILLAACARSEEASLVPADANEMRTVETVRTPERDDQEVALGQWRDSLQEDQSALEFGPAGAPPLFSLRCDERRGVLLQRHGAATVGDLPVMLITIGSETRRLAVTTAGGAIPMLRAALSASDPLVGTLAQSPAPLVIRIGDSAPLVLPPSPAIGAFVRDCAGGAAGDDAPPGNAAEPVNEAAPAESGAAR